MKIKIFLSTIAAPMLVLAFFLSQAEASSQKFSDISTNHPYYKEITVMADAGIIKGSKGEFIPNEKVTRAQAATFMYRTIDIKKVQYVKKQNVKILDVNTTNSHYTAIKAMVDGNKMYTKDGKFEPNKELTRGEMAKLLFLGFNLFELNYEQDPKKHPFTDVSEEYDFYVSYLYDLGITTGDGEKFNEKQTISRQHFSAFLFRTLQYYENRLAIEPKRNYLQKTDTYEDAANIIRKWPIVKITTGGGNIINETLWQSSEIRSILVDALPELLKEVPGLTINGVAGNLLISEKGWKTPSKHHFMGQFNIYDRNNEFFSEIDISKESTFPMLEIILPYALEDNTDATTFNKIKDFSTMPNKPNEWVTLQLEHSNGKVISILKKDYNMMITIK